MVTRKRACVVKDFHDSGTGRLFRKDETPRLTEGEYINYFAAGLLREVDVPAESATPIEADPPA